jgi:hypothetical protein
MKSLFVAMTGLTLLPQLALSATITSPDGRVAVNVDLQDGQLGYDVMLGDSQLVARSTLGLVTSNADFSAGLRIVDESQPTAVRHDYGVPNGKTSHASYEANRRAVTVANQAGDRLSFVVQVSNDGVALAYRLHGDAGEQVRIEQELTAFALPEGATGFLHPMHVAKSGWSKTNPSYEAHYSIDRPVGQPSPDGVGWCFPALFRVGDAGWVLVSETGVDGRFCGSHLAHESNGGVYQIAYPQPGENRESDPVAPTVAGNAQLPWRILLVGETLGPIVESTLATDLVEPKYTSPHEFTTGLAAWSWVFLKDENTTYDVQRQFIDMAADLGWEYILIDSMWDQQIGREKIAELVEYANGRKVRVLLWYNSNGEWNDAPQTPRNRMHTREVRREEMAWMQEVGVKGIKVDFFGGDKQFVMQLCEDILTDAEAFGLAVNFHGTTLPRGWERMFPNFLTNEAVMGMEFVTFEQRNADRQAEHCAVLPFTRNAVGPMDFTPVILSARMGPWRNAPRRRTTDAFELALPVLYWSGIQHLGITPDQVAAQPEFVREYLATVPAKWDETRFLDGYPGRFAALARRSGETWFVAAINGEDAPRELQVPDDLLGEGAAAESGWRLLSDGAEGVVERQVTFSADKPLRLQLGPRGGAVLWSKIARPDANH